ncbi:hypothetical protein ACX3UO_02390 [Corynebacterium coyleae]
MRNAIRNTIAAALTATMAIAGITPANACDACDEQALIAPHTAKQKPFIPPTTSPTELTTYIGTPP